MRFVRHPDRYVHTRIEDLRTLLAEDFNRHAHVVHASARVDEDDDDDDRDASSGVEASDDHIGVPTADVASTFRLIARCAQYRRTKNLSPKEVESIFNGDQVTPDTVRELSLINLGLWSVVDATGACGNDAAAMAGGASRSKPQSRRAPGTENIVMKDAMGTKTAAVNQLCEFVGRFGPTIKGILAIQASSAESERFFSLAKREFVGKASKHVATIAGNAVFRSTMQRKGFVRGLSSFMPDCFRNVVDDIANFVVRRKRARESEEIPSSRRRIEN